MNVTDPREYYPDAQDVDAWQAEILSQAEAARPKIRVLEEQPYDFRMGVRHTGGLYLAVEGVPPCTFYCFWQRCPAGRGPLLVHVPGYGAEMSAHPELVADGYNVLNVNPLGYATPQGPDESKRPNGTWPVLPDTVRSLGQEGYADWLRQAAVAALWGRRHKAVDGERLGFFGTSQGGGGALLLASMFREHGARAVAADVAFLTDLPLSYSTRKPGAGSLAFDPIEEIGRERPDDLAAAWRALGMVDTTCHAHRLTMPTLLLAGADDQSCPAATIRSLFDVLPGTRSYTEVEDQGHAYTTPFLHMARAWFRLHV